MAISKRPALGKSATKAAMQLSKKKKPVTAKKNSSKITTSKHTARSFSDSRYIKGNYRIMNRNKCINTEPLIQYDSSIEYNFIRILENPTINKLIHRWGRETVMIPYFLYDSGKKQMRRHIYKMDFYIEIPSSKGYMRRILVEIKDDNNIRMYKDYITKGLKPQQGRKSASNYLYELEFFNKNVAKWEATKAFVKRNAGYEFYILGKNDIKMNTLPFL